MFGRNPRDRYAGYVYSAVIVLSAALAGLLVRASFAMQVVA